MNNERSDQGTLDRSHIYDERLRNHVHRERELNRRDRRISLLRLTTFLCAFAALAIAYWIDSSHQTVWFGVGAASFAAFLVLVWRHTVLTTEQRIVRAHVRMNTEALHRIARTWDALPIVNAPDEYAELPIVRDLMLFGKGSLAQLLGAPGTRNGRKTLWSWLVTPASPEVIAERQAAIDELAPMLDLRHDLAWRAQSAGRMDPTAFLEWAEGDSWVERNRWIIWLARVLPLCLVASIVLQATGVIDAPVWGAIALANIVLSLGLGERMHGMFDRVATRQENLAAFETPFAIITGATFKSVRLRDLQAQMSAEGVPAEHRMRTLSRLVELAGLHHSQMTHLPIQALTMWDFHVLAALDNWQTHSGRLARRWLSALGEFEALASLAALRFDEPTWSYPHVNSKNASVEATELGHPLIPALRRVANDVSVGPPGTFLLVTGSNMSGKSTLLRAIGLNVVLAQAGASVCASSMSLPPLVVGTSMVIEDSLVEGVSFFMAELRRLREIVALADACHESGECRMLYLLDEILRGTNAVERQIAARRVIMHLEQSGAIGAVSTHDTGLAAIDELTRTSVAVHFQETIDTLGAGTMSFDYRLRPGLATTSNALKLLELVGLGDKESKPLG